MFWLATVTMMIGALLHLPMFIHAAPNGFQMAGMPMDGVMMLGMGLIAAGLGIAAFCLLRAPADLPSRAEAPAVAAPEGAFTFAHWRLSVVLALALVIDVMKPATLGFVVPGMSGEYGIPRSTTALLPFVALAGTTLGSVLWGHLADQVGRRPTILLAALIFIATAICGAMPSFGWNLAMCFAMGLSAGGMMPIAFVLLAETVPARHRGFVLVLLGGVALSGGFVAAAGCAALLEPLFGWRVMWFLNVPTGLIVLALNRFIPESPGFRRRPLLAPPVRARTPSAAGRGRRELLGRPLLAVTAALNLAAVAWGLINFGLLLWLPAELRAHGLSVAGSDLLLFHTALAALPISAGTAWLYRSRGGRATFVAACIVTVCGLLGMALLGTGIDAGLGPYFALPALIAGAGGIIAVILPLAAESYTSAIRGVATGIVAGSSKLGGLMAQCIAVAVGIPSIATASAALALPILLSALLVGRYGSNPVPAERVAASSD